MDNAPLQGSDDPVADYLAGRVDRREFLRRLALIGAGSMVGLSALGSLSCSPEATPTATPTPTISTTDTPAPTPEPGVTVDPYDTRIAAGPVEIVTPSVILQGYLSRPSQGGPHPAVLVIHENRGLQPHFPDITRRLALEGYAALAPDLLSRQGGTTSFATEDQAREAQSELGQEQFLQDLNASANYLRGLPYIQSERLGVIGFCFGGAMTWLMAVRNEHIRAAVPFYGSAPPLDEVPNLSSPVLGIYAENDTRINAGIPDLEAALQEHQKQYEFIIYPDTDHAFFNDTAPRYHPQAAQEAWAEALAWFEQHLTS